jgi:hypothetical protein
MYLDCEHSVKPKKSWSQTLKGLGAGAQKFLTAAPKAVQAFVSDPAVRKQAIAEGVKGVRSLPKKVGSNLLATCKAEVKEFKEAHAGVKAVMSGQKMSKHQKHAFRTVATHLAIGVAAAALTASSPLAGAGLFAKGMARHIAAKSVHRSLEKAHLLDELGHIGHAVEHILTASDEQLAQQPQGPDDAERAMMKLIMYSVSKELESLSDEDLVQILISMSENDTGAEEQPKGDEPSADEPKQPEAEPNESEDMTKEARILSRILSR